VGDRCLDLVGVQAGRTSGASSDHAIRRIKSMQSA
jgi:hypothetical protein